MHNSLDLFQTASAMARHAGARQAVVARNIANADTPDFQAQSIAAFRDVYRGSASASMRTSRPNHIQALPDAAMAPRTLMPTGAPSPNGNTVSIEEEMMNSVAVSREHNRALSVYRHAMTIIRTSLGRN